MNRCRLKLHLVWLSIPENDPEVRGRVVNGSFVPQSGG